MNNCFSSKFALESLSVLLSFLPIICSPLPSLFPRYLIFFAALNQKPIQIIETVKQISSPFHATALF